MMSTVTVYKAPRLGFRVVTGEHSLGSYGEQFTHREYADAAEAYKVETDPHIRAAIARIDPSVLAIPASSLHHFEKGKKESAVRTRFKGPAGREYMVTEPAPEPTRKSGLSTDRPIQTDDRVGHIASSLNGTVTDVENGRCRVRWDTGSTMWMDRTVLVRI